MSIELVIGLYKGFHFESELRALNRIAAEITDGVIVSIGGYRGQMDCALAMHANVPVYCIDPHISSDGYPFGDEDRVYWMQNVLAMNVGAKVRPINLPSLTVASIWNEPISLLWIDGNHVNAKADFDAWFHHVKDGGLIAFHDTNSPLIQAAYQGRDDLVEIEVADVTRVFRKEQRYEPYEYNGVTILTRNGVYNSADKHALQEAADYDLSGGTVLDIGAHIGSVTCTVKAKYPDALVKAVEPESSNFDLLSRNVSGLPDVQAYHAFLGYDPAIKFVLRDPVNSGGHRMITDATITQPVEIAPERLTLEQLMVGQFEYIDLLKLDCEGGEIDVLLNAEDETLCRIKKMIGERHVTSEQFQPVIERLESLGFTVEDRPHPELSVEPWNMKDRGLFTAVNQREMVAEVPQQEVRAKPGRKPKR